jgi:prefoldin subunit 5
MGDTRSLDEINTVLDQFSDQIAEIRTQPAKVDEAFRKAAIAAAEAEAATFFGLAGAVAGAVYGAITEDDFTGYMQDHKEVIKKRIQELLEKLQGAVDSLKAPIAFLQTSEAWSQLESKIGEAQNNEVANGNVIGYWAGAAALRYTAARTLQDTAMDSAKSICNKLSAALAQVSDTAWDFYSKIVKDVADLITALGSALLKIGTFVAAPVGISDAIDVLGKMINKAIEYTDKLADSLLSQRGTIIGIIAATSNPKGFHTDHWPRSASDDFDINSPSTEWQAT